MITKAAKRGILYALLAILGLFLLTSSRSSGPLEECRLFCRGQRVDFSKGKPSSWINGQYFTLSKVDTIEVVDGQISYKPGDKPVEVIFQEPHDPRSGWVVVGQLETWGSVPVYVTMKKSPGSFEKHDVAMNEKLKIVQLADLHFSSFEGICRDQYPEVADCRADERTTRFVEKVLDLEKPSLVVLTGDQIFGEDSFHSQTTMLKVVKPLIDRQIPYITMFGNHDDEGSLDREELAEFITHLPYSLMERGPRSIEGVGNYVLNIPEEGPKLTLYVLDSHKYSPNAKVLPGYDWLKEGQIEWIKSQKSTAPLSMAFFHIPLPEYTHTQSGATGNYKEPVTAPKYNTGARDVLQDMGVSVVSVGHDHCNDYCLNDKGKNAIWLCYGGGSGEGGYGGYGGTTRRIRVFDVDTTKGQITTWKRLETTMEKFDEQVLVKEGEVV